ncbi:hypothetical protein HF670_08935 [Acidithiobacillus thiooxidans]|uniref:hypothetical protein n=1 Tax=Acidithiobacillus TaxID=119977 RepID=UPI0002625392|nr:MULTISPECIES: hypothetical protein [Acidithiobacillus]MBU2812234.1 hypothetical protein [Acidithiobacillus thiooxidans]MBU2839686.1 hypothetical protein [Acidithiobacillus thiooxidans]
MKIRSSLTVQGEPEAQLDDHAILDILDVLETRHDLVNEQWYALRAELSTLNEEQVLDNHSQKKVSDHSLLMEQELSRYQRFFHIFRQNLLQKKANRAAYPVLYTS